MNIDTWTSFVEAAWASRRPDNVAALYAEDGWRIEHATLATELTGREAITARITGLFEAVSDGELSITWAGGDDETRVLEWVFSGTHQRAAHAGHADLPVRREHVQLAGVSVCQMDGDLIAVERTYFDAATLPAGAG